MVRLSMNELTTYRWSFEDDVRHYQAAGFEGIGIWREKLADYGEKQGIELIAEAGLEVSTLFWAGGFTGSDGRTHQDAIEDALEAIQLAAQLQAGCLMVHSGCRSGHTQGHALRCFRDALRELLPVAKEHGVTLALEPMHTRCAKGWTFLTDLDQTLNFIQTMNSSHLKLTFDSYHLTHERSILRRLPELVPYLALVQLGDARHAPRDEQSRCRLGEGSLPIPSLVNALIEAGYNGFFEIELMGEEIEACCNHSLLAHSRQTFDDLIGSPQAK